MDARKITTTAPTETLSPGEITDDMGTLFDEIVIDPEMDLETYVLDPGEGNKRSLATIVVITPIGPGPKPWLKEAMSSFVRATEKVTAKVSWVIAGGTGVDYAHITQLTGEEPVAPGSKVDPGAIMVVRAHGHCPDGTSRNIALMSVPEDAWVVNLDADYELLPDRLAIVNDLDHVDVHLCAADELLPRESGGWQRVPPGVPRPACPLEPGWFDRSRINGGGTLDVRMETLAIRARVLKSLGGYPGLPYCEGTVLARRIDENGYQGMVTDEVGYFHRKNSEDMDTVGYEPEPLINYWTD